MMSFRWILLCSLCLALGSTSCSKSKKTTAKRPTESRTERSALNVKSRYAGILEVEESAIRNTALYSFIQEWEGTPYKFGGTSTSGVDCSGFAVKLYESVYEKQIPRTTAELSQQVGRGSGRLKEGDLVFFDINGKKTSHVGVYLQNDRFVHASSSRGVIISDLNNKYYKNAYSKGGSP